jgi:primosomal protein N' (replication factor Y)
VPDKCPKCADKAFKFSGIGTQRVESIVEKLFPHARIHRMDSDSTGLRGSHDRILGEFRTGKLDILVGTQMIAKGLDFPNVTLIGIIYADLALHMPDFRAAERAFQLLTQVAGRAGRGDVPGEVIVQTFTPQHAAVQAALRMDFEGFYKQECESRRELRYPPFAHLVCVTVKGRVDSQVAFAIEAFTRSLKPRLPAHVVVAGPAAAPMPKAKGYYRHQLILRSKSARSMVQPIRELLAGFKWPAKVACSVDVDAVSLL